MLAACDVLHHQGVAATTLAHVAQAAEVPLGNVYYYFKTKDDILRAVVHEHVDQDEIARYGCPYGTLAAELGKRDDGTDLLAAQLMQIPLDWAEQQFRAMDATTHTNSPSNWSPATRAVRCSAAPSPDPTSWRAPVVA